MSEEASEAADENAVTPIDGEGEGKKSKFKLILFILIPLILLGGGGAGLYFTGKLDKYLGKEEAKDGEEGGEHAEGAKEGEGEHGEGGANAEVAFLKIPDMIVNLNTPDGGQPRYLRLSVQLELANAVDQAAVEKVLPRVVDQFQTYLRELRVQDLRGSKGMYRLQMELLSRVNAAAAPTQVKDVLFQEILIQ